MFKYSFNIMISQKYGGTIMLHPLKLFSLGLSRLDRLPRVIVRNSYSYSISGDRLDGVASHTLQSRLIKYLRTDVKYKDNSFHLSSLEDNRRITPLLQDVTGESSLRKLISTLSDKQLSLFVYYLNETGNRSSSLSIKALIQRLDEECCSRSKNMDRRNILRFLDAWFYVIPNRITSLHFYCMFVSNVSFWLPVSNYSLQDIIHPLFFVGLQKKSSQGMNAVSACLQKIDPILNGEMSIEELCIVTSVAYKTSTKITSVSLLRLICSMISSNIQKLLHDEALFVTLIKSLRHAQFHDYDLMDKIAGYIISDPTSMKNFNLAAKVHILAMYADALHGHCDLIEPLVQSCISDLSSDTTATMRRSLHVTIRPRMKDISRFLWAVSYIGYHLNYEVMDNVLIPQLMKRLSSGEYSRHPEEIINSILSIWILGYKPEELFMKAVTKEAMRHLKSKTRYRHNSRLLLLLRCVNIEMPHLLSEEHLGWKSTNVAKADLQKHIQKRILLQKVYTKMKSLSNTSKYDEVTLEFSIPNLNIAGIVMKNLSGDVLHIEVLDPTVCLYKSCAPHGLMQLKIRLLKALGKDILIINQEKFDSLADITSILAMREELKKHTKTA